MDYAILNCLNGERWSGWDLELVEVLGLPKDRVKVFATFLDEHPSEEQLQKIKYIIITGSPCSCYEEIPWIVNLEIFVKNVASHHPEKKIVGFCFGAQMLGKALGGKVGKNVCGKFLFGAEPVTFLEAEKQPEFLRKLNFPSEIQKIITSHGDCVLELPENAVHLGKSERNENESFSIGENIVAIQVHPEFTRKIADSVLYPFIKANNVVPEPDLSTAINNIRTELNHLKFIRFVQNFIDVPKRFAILNCEDDPNLADHDKYIWVNQLSSSGCSDDTQWDCFKVYENQFPLHLSKYSGFVVTGSRHSVHDKDPWIQELFRVIQEIYRDEIPLYACCFGAQAVATALGGAVSPNPCGYYIYGYESVQLLTPLDPAGADTKCEINLAECHGECVSKLPPNATLIGTTDLNTNELFKIGNSIVCSQFHPELNNESLTQLILPGLLDEKLITDEKIKEAEETYKKPIGNELFLEHIKKFLGVPKGRFSTTL